MSDTRERPLAATPLPCAAVILAAGKSTRMRSRVPKALHPLCGLPLTRHVVDACRGAGIEHVVVVVGHGSDLVCEGLGADLDYAVQAEQRGSGDAARAAEPRLSGFVGDVLVLAGDVPLLRAGTLQRLVEHHRASGASATLLTAYKDDATGYGRIIRGADGTVARIVEQKDASPEERAIREWNPSIYCFNAPSLFAALSEVRADNAQGEYYLTDVVGIMKSRGLRVEGVPVDDGSEVLGVNNRVELAEAAGTMRLRLLRDLMLSGVTLLDPATTYVDAGVQIGQDTVIEAGTHVLRGAVVGERCHLGPDARIADSHIGDDTEVVASQVVGCQVGSDVRIGPYTNLRPGCRVADHVRIGDFVELKNTVLGEGVATSHLTYLGDTEVGAGANIGAGTVTCNYDGVRKHRTLIGSNAFVGSHTTLIAPITIGDGAVVAAGSPVTEDVPPGSLVIARSRPTIKPEWARKRRDKASGA